MKFDRMVQQDPSKSVRKPEAPAREPEQAPPDPVARLQQVVGNKAVQRLVQDKPAALPPKIQAKLSVTPPDDQYEKEADAVAHEVMTMPAPVQREEMPEEELQMKRIQREEMPEEELQMKAIQREEMPEEELQMKRIQREEMPEEELQMKRIQREEMPEEELQMKRIQREEMPEEELQMKAIQRQMPMDDEEELQAKRVQRDAEQNSGLPPVTDDIESQIDSSRGSGSSLPDNARGFFESRMDADFSGVRIHTGGDSDQLNRSLDARAFTTGSDIFFRDGEYNPDSNDGRELLAHELTHVVQQNAAPQRKADDQE
jgi:hypothetical protein